jgi:hypothetical protein
LQTSSQASDCGPNSVIRDIGADEVFSALKLKPRLNIDAFTSGDP